MKGIRFIRGRKNRFSFTNRGVRIESCRLLGIGESLLFRRDKWWTDLSAPASPPLAPFLPFLSTPRCSIAISAKVSEVTPVWEKRQGIFLGLSTPNIQGFYWISKRFFFRDWKVRNPKSGGIIFERRGQRIFLHLKKGEENFSKSEKNRGGGRDFLRPKYPQNLAWVPL